MSRYDDGRYARAHPDWHAEDAPAKAEAVLDALRRAGWAPRRVLDAGCGTGAVLHALRAAFDADGRRDTRFDGWDPSPDAIARGRTTERVQLHVGDPTQADPAELGLALDVLEHLDDPVGTLRAWSTRAPRWVLRLPVDVSLLDVLRPARMEAAREDYGHLWQWTRTEALAVVRRAGLEVVHVAHHRIAPPTNAPRARLVDGSRRLAHTVAPEAALALLGGWSLVVTAHRP